MSNRTYTTALNDGKGAGNFPYIWDSALVTSGAGRPITGAWRVYTTADISTSTVNVSGVTLQVGAVAITGNPQVTVSNALLATSGNVTVVNTAPIPFSGSVNVINPILAVSGNFGAGGSSTILLTGNSLVGITGGTLNVAVTGGVLSSSSSSIALTGFSPTLPPLPISGAVTASTIDTGNRSVFLVNQAVVNSGGWVGVTGFSSLIAPLAVSGTFSATIGNVTVTGGTVNVLDSLGWALLSGISGQLVANLSGAAWVTGSTSGSNLGSIDMSRTYMPVSGVSTFQTNVTNTAPIAISGVVNTVVTGGSVNATVANPIGVTGNSLDKALPVINGFITNFLAIGGRVVNPSGAGSITGYNNTGDMAMLNIAPNGGVYMNQGILDKTQDEITVWTTNTGIGPVTSVSGLAPTFFGVALPNNPNRRAWFAQSIGTGHLLVKMGTGNVTTGSFDILLKGATTHFAGDGASYSDSPAIYTGPVSVTGFGGAPCVYRIWEL